jgi:esterase/lipase
MQVNKIQTYPSYKQRRPLAYKTYNLSNNQNISSDVFIKNHQPELVVFTGETALQKFIISYMKNKSYSNSINASRRLFVPLSDDLKKITKEISIEVSKKEAIKAFDINPNNSNKYIIFLHGFAQNITSNQELYKALSQTNFGVLAIDYRGYGRNPVSKHVTENDIVQDVRAAAKYLNKKGINNISLLGHSFGSYIAAKTSNLNNSFNFQILVSPMLSLEFWFKKVIKHPLKYKSEMRMIKYIPNFCKQYEKTFKIGKHIEQNSTPTFVVQSKKDTYVRTSKVNELVAKIPQLKCYTVLTGGCHRMDEDKIHEIVRILSNL